MIRPNPGIYFGVTVVDFASLYPSIIKAYNISYETVRCPHEECHSNMLPLTNHWCCTKKYGMTSLLIGSLRDLRVQYYKRLSKDQSIPEEMRGQYSTVAQALKVILNAAYGVLGADIFPLYFPPAAEAVTAIGRNIIQGSVQICKDNGVEVLYGDTDSVFVLAPTQKQINDIIEQTRTKYKVDLEIDKAYKYCVFSDRKKNYYGMLDTGDMDIKGLAGKKSNTPPFVRKLFTDVTDALKEIETRNDIDPVLEKVTGTITGCIQKLRAGTIPLESMAFTNMLGWNLKDYSITLKQDDIERESLDVGPGKHPLKNAFNPDSIKCPLDARVYSRLPLHVKAALWTCDKAASDTTTVRKAEAMLAGANLKKGDAVTYVKMTNPTAALPLGMFAPADNAAMKWNAPKTFQDKLERCDIVEFGKTTCSVDVEKYVTLVIATFNPILEPLGIELQAKKSKKTHKQQKPDNNLDVFFQEDTA